MLEPRGIHMALDPNREIPTPNLCSQTCERQTLTQNPEPETAGLSGFRCLT